MVELKNSPDDVDSCQDAALKAYKARMGRKEDIIGAVAAVARAQQALRQEVETLGDKTEKDGKNYKAQLKKMRAAADDAMAADRQAGIRADIRLVADPTIFGDANKRQDALLMIQEHIVRHKVKLAQAFQPADPENTGRIPHESFFTVMEVGVLCDALLLIRHHALTLFVRPGLYRRLASRSMRSRRCGWWRGWTPRKRARLPIFSSSAADETRTASARADS